MWIDDQEKLKKSASNYFKALFTEDNEVRPSIASNFKFPIISIDILCKFDVNPSLDEIHKALLAMKGSIVKKDRNLRAGP